MPLQTPGAAPTPPGSLSSGIYQLSAALVHAPEGEFDATGVSTGAIAGSVVSSVMLTCLHSSHELLFRSHAPPLLWPRVSCVASEVGSPSVFETHLYKHGMRLQTRIDTK